MKNIAARALPALGLLGTLLCVLGIFGVWYVEIRIDRVTSQFFGRLNESLAAGRKRLANIEDAVEGTVITTNDIRQKVTELAVSEAGQTLSARLQIETRVEKLDGGLEKIGLLLDASSATLLDIRQTLVVGESLGLPVEVDFLKPILETLTNLQNEVHAAGNVVESISGRIRGEDSDVAEETRREQALVLTARVLATFGELDKRLGNLQARLADTQDRIAELQAKSRRRIITVAVAATILLAWMLAGQLALWRRGYSSYSN